MNERCPWLAQVRAMFMLLGWSLITVASLIIGIVETDVLLVLLDPFSTSQQPPFTPEMKAVYIFL
jgi:secreted protein with Ig-like and vWFA domain